MPRRCPTPAHSKPAGQESAGQQNATQEPAGNDPGMFVFKKQVEEVVLTQPWSMRGAIWSPPSIGALSLSSRMGRRRPLLHFEGKMSR